MKKMYDDYASWSRIKQENKKIKEGKLPTPVTEVNGLEKLTLDHFYYDICN